MQNFGRTKNEIDLHMSSAFYSGDDDGELEISE